MGHLQANGFKVEKKDVFGKQFTDVKSKYGVPQRLYSCHTGVIDGYVIEGHVPADLNQTNVKRKAADRWTSCARDAGGLTGHGRPETGAL